MLRAFIARKALSPGRLLNVNFPKLNAARPAPLGVRVVEQSTAVMQDIFERRQDPRGRTYYWIATPEKPIVEALETDATALEAGYVTITPLQFDLTHRRHLAELRALSPAERVAQRYEKFRAMGVFSEPAGAEA